MKNTLWQPTLETKRSVYNFISDWSHKLSKQDAPEYAVIVLHKNEVIAKHYFEPLNTGVKLQDWLNVMNFSFMPLMLSLRRQLKKQTGSNNFACLKGVSTFKEMGESQR